MVVSPVFESLIRLRSHTVRLFTGMTTAFCNLTHTRKILAMFTRSVFGIDNRIYLQVWVLKCPVWTRGLRSVFLTPGKTNIIL